MATEEDIKRYMERALSGVPPHRRQEQAIKLRKIVVDTLASGQPVDWNTKPVPDPPAPTLRELGDFHQMLTRMPPSMLSQMPQMPPQLASMIVAQKPAAQKAATSSTPAIVPMKITKRDRDLAEKRKLRFQNDSSSPAKRVASNPSSTEPVIGESEALEKQYLRLTSAPRPENVRPKRVLKKALNYVLEKYQENQKYSYIVSQMKSIRQDLNVQGIKDGFTVRVYETNARIALTNRDMGEFNQCLSRLSELYQDPELGYTLTTTSGEFVSYHIYYVLYTQAYQDLDIMLSKINATAQMREDAKVQIALDLVEACTSQDPQKVFYIHSKADDLSKIAMEIVVKRERLAVLTSLTKARKQGTIPLSELVSVLRMGSEEEVRVLAAEYTQHIEDDEIVCKLAHVDFERAKEAMTSVDIKGQI